MILDQQQNGPVTVDSGHPFPELLCFRPPWLVALLKGIMSLKKLKFTVGLVLCSLEKRC